jgi:purine-binding chemotaxis protein CheW
MIPADQTQRHRDRGHWKPEFIRFVTKWNDEFAIVPELEDILNSSQCE